MKNILVWVLGSFILNSLHSGDAQVQHRAVVTLHPNWPKIYREEKMTIRCDIDEGEDAEWEYDWKTNGSIKPPNQREYGISAYVFHSGHYKCRGRNVTSKESRTKWSDPVKLTVHGYLPKPVLRVSPSWLSPGASVTLNCEVEHPFAGWRFYWYQMVPDLSDNTYRKVLLPDSTNGTEEVFFIPPGQTTTAQYVCRAGRRAFYTHFSEPVFVWSRVSDGAASLTVSPDRKQLSSESVSLTCEGASTEWRVMRFTETGASRCHGWGVMSGSTCTVLSLQYSEAVYWCESGSGEFSNAVNVTIHTSRPESSLFTVMLVAAFITGGILVLLLLLSYQLIKSNSPCSNRSPQTRSSNKDQQMKLNEAREHVYSFLSEGDGCIYESLSGCVASGNGTDKILVSLFHRDEQILRMFLVSDGTIKELSGVRFQPLPFKAGGQDENMLDNQTTTI